MMSPLDTLRRLGGVARVSRLRTAGASPSDLRDAVASGALIRIRKGWMALPDAHPELVRAVALGGRVACLSAARHLGLWTPDEEGSALHIARPRHAGRTFGDPGGCVEHWQSQTWSSRDSAVESIDALVRQALLCLAYEDALTIVDSALHKRLLSQTRLRRIVESLPARFTRVLDDVDGASESGLETLCRLRLAVFGVTVRTQVEFPGIGRVDLVIGDRIVLEADGREWHSGESSFLADRSRDLALTRLGYVVIRVTYQQVIHEWQLIETAIDGMIGRNEHVWSAAHRRDGLTG